MSTENLAIAIPAVLRGAGVSDLRAEDLSFEPLAADGRSGAEIHRLYTTEQTGAGGPAAGIVRYAPGASSPPHRHEGYEIIYVFAGQLETGAGEHPAGSLLVMEPGSIHAPRSAHGALMLVVWEKPVMTL
jgi:quercetin dioxygenase-like cupin family protein